MKYIGDVIGVKPKDIQCGRTEETPGEVSIVVTTQGRTHDILFLGRDGRSRTMLWNIDPRVRIECSQIVLG